MTELVEVRGLKVALSCRLFGHTRQAWYQSRSDIAAKVEFERLLLDNVREIRQEDPRIGSYKLWLMLCDIHGRDRMMGRDSFFALLRRHGLMLPPPKPRHTTNSNYRRPHMSIGYKIPAVVHMETGPQKKMWKKKNYPKKMCDNENNDIPLPCRTTGEDDGCNHHILYPI